MDHLKQEKRKRHPKEKANVLSLITFAYTLKWFWKGFKKDLEEKDLYSVQKTFRSKRLGDKLELEWEKQKKKRKHTSIMSLLWACYGWEYFFIGILQLVVKTVIILVEPHALGKIVGFFTPGQREITQQDAYYYAGILIGINFLNTFFTHNYDLIVHGLGIQVRTAFCSLLYRKALKLSPTQLGDISIGKIVTLITKDLHTFESFIHFANNAWIGIIKSIVIFYLIYDKIGIAALAGIAFFVFIIPLQIYLGSWCTKLRLQMSKATDSRLQLTQETLSAARIIKMYTWEWFFKKKIGEARKQEIRKLHKIFYLTFIVLQTGTLNAKIAFYLLIMTYSWLGNPITAEIVFFIMSCFSILRLTMSILFPVAISQTAALVAAVKRVGNVLKAMEIATTPQNSNMTIKPKIIIKEMSVNFNDKEILHQISQTFDLGLNLLTGACGSGKSFLLKTILQDYEAHTGGVVTHGRISYASQEPWLFPSSIKQNIVFGEKFDNNRYKKVLNVCALQYDLQLLPCGDETIVEDRGINLSKGQQARINLARAVYKDSDIYLLDDCLSALDAHVSQFIFNECIKKFLQNKLVLLVSHNIKLIPEVDNVVLLRDGKVQSSGTPSKIEIAPELLEESEALLSENDEKENEDNVNEKSKLITEQTVVKKVYQERKEEGKVSMEAYKSYMQFAGGCFACLFVFCFFTSAQFALSYSDQLVSKWVNLEIKLSNLTSNSTEFNATETIKEHKNSMLILYSVMIVVSSVLALTRSFALFHITKKASINIHRYMTEHIVSATMSFFDTNFIGNILNRFSKDLGTIDEHFIWIVNHFITTLCHVVGIIILIAKVNQIFLIPSAVTLIILILLRYFYIPTGRSLKRLDAITRSPVIGHLNATLEGLTTVRAFGAEQILQNEFDRHQDLYISANYTYVCSYQAFAFFLDALCTMFSTSVVCWFVFVHNDILAGSVGLAITQAFMLTGTLQWGVRQWADIENSMTSVERVLEYTKVKQETDKGIQVPNWPSRGEVSYKNVSLSYGNNEEYVLKNINIDVKPQQKIGVVGRTGAGKSSIISSLFRLYEVKGTILIDGMDTKTLSLDFLRKHISIIPQDPVLFTGTIRDNIDPTRMYTDEEIWRAIEVAHLKNIVPSLEFEIAENGSNFSVGQRQLICVARACIQNNKIIVLDEATANMDQETDSLIYDTIHQNFKSCTVFTIAHKLHTVLGADKVMVMDKGEVIEFDKPENLLQNPNGAFYKMVKKADLLPSSAITRLNSVE